MKKVGILGMGEVGKAIASFYEDPYTMDLENGHFPENLDILHICIPWSNDFIATVVKTAHHHAKGGLVIIHSTVPVGTTEHIGTHLQATLLVHSPIRGVHPHLAEGIREFVKYIGADTPGAARIAAEHFEELGLKIDISLHSRTTELLKLLDTTYYGIAIAFHDYAAKLCELEGLKFEQVMTKPNVSYNEGYAGLGMAHVVRPVLFPPAEGKIGGHCVVPNAELLKAQFGEDPLLEAIISRKS